jgi:hypothetical protein
MLTAPLKAGESPRAKPVMIPIHTSKAPAAAVERSFKSWFTGPDLFPKGLLRVPRGLPGRRLTAVIHPIAWKENSGKSTSRLVNMLNAGSSDGVLDV